jgi:hypothetical protein
VWTSVEHQQGPANCDSPLHKTDRRIFKTRNTGACGSPAVVCRAKRTPGCRGELFVIGNVSRTESDRGGGGASTGRGMDVCGPFHYATA